MPELSSATLGATRPASLTHGEPQSPGEFPLTLSTYTAPGVHIPPGALDAWFAARNAHAHQLVEVAWFGDSTMAGQTLDEPLNRYSPITRVRELLAADGYTDGGHGWLNGPNDVPSVSGEPEDAGIVENVGFEHYNIFVISPGEASHASDIGNHMTIVVYGRYLRIWYVRFNSSGRFTYAIDGGSAVPIDPTLPTPGQVATRAHADVVDMGTDGRHEIVITNCGRVTPAPIYSATPTTGDGSDGSLTPGTYDYAAAYETSDGKIAPIGATRTVTITSGQGYTSVFGPQPEAGGCTINVYRRVSGVGNFKKVGSVAANTGGFATWRDTGAASGIDYAGSPTPVFNPDMAYASVAVDVVRDNGIVLHNHAARASGSSMVADPYNLAVALGLDLEPGVTVEAIDRDLDEHPAAHHPSLVVLSHGINDLQGSGGADTSPTAYAHTVVAIRAAKRVGASVLVTIPAFEASDQTYHTSDLYRDALKAAAEDEGAAWIDIGKDPGALGPYDEWDDNEYFSAGNAHLTNLAYHVQGPFIYAILGAR